MDATIEMVKQADPEILAHRNDVILKLLLTDRTSSIEKLRMLLKHGLDPNAIDEDGKSFFERAIGERCTDMAMVLLEYGADLIWNRPDGNTSAICAAMAGGTRMLLEVIKRAGPDYPWLAHWTPGRRWPNRPVNVIQAAVAQGRPQCLRVLFEETDLASHIDDVVGGETAAHMTASGRFDQDPDCLAILVQHGADLTIQDEWGASTPLHIACERYVEERGSRPRDTTMIDLIAQAEPRALSIQDANGGTPMDIVADYEEVIQVLKKYEHTDGD